ncbi:hypothetical protein LTR64_007326 [Lithohypha guttulata]|uniref:uncharacterized protein n=1 Tax=Lithohypha guttulata TaxID=1690604 RepID=UPI002DE05164|nr:hypothetical protein LTR51_004117 [Lithohypha guttulata]
MKTSVVAVKGLFLATTQTAAIPPSLANGVLPATNGFPLSTDHTTVTTRDEKTASSDSFRMLEAIPYSADDASHKPNPTGNIPGFSVPSDLPHSADKIVVMEPGPVLPDETPDSAEDKIVVSGTGPIIPWKGPPAGGADNEPIEHQLRGMEWDKKAVQQRDLKKINEAGAILHVAWLEYNKLLKDFEKKWPGEKPNFPKVDLHD